MPQIPFAFQCAIPENELFQLKDSTNGRLLSDSVTNIPDFEYCLAIYPNGDFDERRGITCAFLRMEFKNVKKVEVDCMITIESANHSFALQYTYEESKGWGYSICNTEELFDPEKNFIIDGKCTIKVFGMFKYELDDNTLSSEQQKWQSGEIGNELWERDDTKDFTIVVDGVKEIKVHKFIISHRSEVFAAMLRSNMKENEENKMTITDFSFNVVETAVKLIYDCNCSTALSLDELMKLLQFFDKYNLTSLKAKVEPYLINQISASTVVSLTNASVLTNSFLLKEKCMEFLSACFKQQTPLSDFKTLDNDVLLEVVENSFYQNLAIKK